LLPRIGVVGGGGISARFNTYYIRLLYTAAAIYYTITSTAGGCVYIIIIYTFRTSRRPPRERADGVNGERRKKGIKTKRENPRKKFSRAAEKTEIIKGLNARPIN